MPSRVYMEAPKRPNYPYLITRDTCPTRANLEVFRFSPSDGCPVKTTLLSLDASLTILTHVLRFEASRRQRPGRSDHPPWWLDRPRQSDRPSWAVEPAWVAAPPRRVFGLTFVAQLSNPVVSGDPLQTPRTRCSLRQSPLMTRLPRSPGSTLFLRLNQETVNDFIPLFLPSCGPHLTSLATGSLELSLLVFSTPRGLTATTFRACSSPAPTPVKPQPAPTILSQESVHTMLSITHHTRKQPSTVPRTTHGPHLQVPAF
jgi:hypothetical protein